MAHSIKSKIISTFRATIILIILLAIVAGFVFGDLFVRHRVFSEASVLASAVALLIEQDEAVVIDGPADSEAYRELRELMRQLVREEGYAYLSVYEYDESMTSVTYYLCVAADDKADEEVSVTRAKGAVVEHTPNSEELDMLEGEGETALIEVDDQFGHEFYYCQEVNLPDKLLVVQLDYSAFRLMAHIMQVVLAFACVTAIALGVLLFFELRVLNRRVFTPLGTISKRMTDFAENPDRAIEPLSIGTQDEMGGIASSFESMAADINAYLCDIERMTSERVQTSVEMDVARRIQLGMVPERSKACGVGYEAIALSRPAKAVGGDFYDLIERDDGSIALVVGDVSGKGVAAAIFMAMAKTMIREGLAAGGDPVDVLGRVNQNVCHSNPEGMFASVFACVLDPTSGKVEFANAGHLPPVIVGTRDMRIEVDSGDLIGLFDDAVVGRGSVQLEPGQYLLVYTDGVSEALGSDGSFLGEDRFIAQLRDGASYGGVEDLADDVIAAVNRFAEGCDQFDDITVAALALRPDGPLELSVDISSLAAIREAVFALDVESSLKRKACLVCEEAFSNIVNYSGAKHVWLHVSQIDGGFRFRLADDGKEFNPLKAARTQVEFDELDKGGMGIGLMCDLASKIDYTREENRNVLTATFFS